MTDETLKPCPYCGGVARITFTGILPDVWWEVACSDGCASVGKQGAEKPTKAVVCERWNSWQHAGR